MGVGAVVRGAELTRLGATDLGAEPRRPSHVCVEVAADVADLNAEVGAELGALICVPSLLAYISPLSSRACIICSTLFWVFIRTSTRPTISNDKFDLGKSD